MKAPGNDSDHERTDPERDLIDAIRKGRCVAFVGAGLSYPTVGGWGDLLEAVARRTGNSDLEQRVAGLIASAKDNVDYEAAAQLLADDDERLGEHVAATIHEKKANAKEKDRTVVDNRVALLERIPFDAILTTNFDGYLDGEDPCGDIYRAVLRTDGREERRYDSAGSYHRRPIINLHGRLDAPKSILLTRRAYRRRLYTEPGYRRFLSTLFSTHTVVYIGFSFTDAYINDIRSEILAMFGREQGDTPHKEVDLPTAYAILADPPVSVPRRDFLGRHEGIRVIPYEARGEGHRDHSEFDALLSRIAGETSAEANLKRIARGKKVLWLDPNPTNNLYASGALEHMDGCGNVEEAIEKLSHGTYDLVITHFGRGMSRRPDEYPSVAEELLTRMVRPRHSAPVIVFGALTRKHAEDNRDRLLRAGAIAYTATWDGLFAAIDRVLGDVRKYV